MIFFEAIDELLIKFFTKISHKIQRATGVTSYSLAKYSLGVCVLSVFTHFANFFFPYLLGRETDLISVFLLCWVLLYFARIFFPLCDKAEQALLEGKILNIKDVIPFGVRFFSFCSCVIGLFIWFPQNLISREGIFVFVTLENIYFLFMFAFIYFLTVEPFPPAKEEIYEYVESKA